MTLYHGTNADIKVIDLAKGLQYKDFGKGFYLTPDRNTAIRMAQKKHAFSSTILGQSRPWPFSTKLKLNTYESAYT